MTFNPEECERLARELADITKRPHFRWSCQCETCDLTRLTISDSLPVASEQLRAAIDAVGSATRTEAEWNRLAAENEALRKELVEAQRTATWERLAKDEMTALRDSLRAENERLTKMLNVATMARDVARHETCSTRLRDALVEEISKLQAIIGRDADTIEGLRKEVGRLKGIERDRNYALQCQNEQLEVALRERDELRTDSGVKKWASDVRLAARYARFRPREDEVDSVMSLLNWTREKHDRDSSARQWLERVVAALLEDEPKEERCPYDTDCIGCGMRIAAGTLTKLYEEGYVHSGGCDAALQPDGGERE